MPKTLGTVLWLGRIPHTSRGLNFARFERRTSRSVGTATKCGTLPSKISGWTEGRRLEPSVHKGDFGFILGYFYICIYINVFLGVPAAWNRRLEVMNDVQAQRSVRQVIAEIA